MLVKLIAGNNILIINQLLPGQKRYVAGGLWQINLRTMRYQEQELSTFTYEKSDPAKTTLNVVTTSNVIKLTYSSTDTNNFSINLQPSLISQNP